MARFVDAYNPDTGRKHRVPEHFLDHPVLGRGLSRTPRQQVADDLAEPGTAPSPQHDVHHPVDDTDDTPASGDQEE